ncbi:HlyD family efflux transporter periplasmic adaptor subunit [Thalassoglobus sp.]|uniref:efflux RND transporter periplasmic adaptor subunit n=1 Tax=Thalassoglobus sp. TaxID=2795869 RepID=UPI003AA7E10B
MTSQIDLKQLSSASPKGETRPQGQIQRPQRIISRYVLPAAILLGFVGMVGWAARDQFESSKAVTVVPVVVTRAEVQTAGTPLFQAAGWVEPRPSRRLATALTSGIVEEVYVVEGEQVEVGQKLARLIDTDAKLELQQAQANLALREAELQTTRAHATAAQQRLESPMKLQAQVADAQSTVADAELQQARLPFQIQTMKARAKFAEQSYLNRKDAGQAVARSLIQEAESEYVALNAELANLQNQSPLLEKRIEALRAKAEALQVEREKLIDERRSLNVADAEVQVAQARLLQAQLAVKNAELRLSRTVIKSPIQGRVLEVLAFPGSSVMGQNPQSNPEASTVVSLYHPEQLQIRADVRLEDLPLVHPGQPVLIETAISSTPIEGHVLLGTSRANIQKNTLEVKAAIHSPPESIRPEMLVRATFLAADRESETENGNTEQERMLIPRKLVTETDSGSTVWIVSAERTAHQQKISLGTAGTDVLVEVTSGLTPTDRVISVGRENLQEGDKVAITNEEE